MKLLIIVLSLMVANIAFAANKACFCEVGTYPQKQQRAFSLGCSLWLNAQRGCTLKQKIVHQMDYTRMTFAKGISELSIGYVGHWNDSVQLVNYIDQYIKPLLSRTGLSVNIDNTACRSMESPNLILDYVRSLRLQPHQNLRVKGNQVDSIGKWDVLLGSSHNFYASVSNSEDRVRYPACKEFQSRNCLYKIQQNETGTCTDRNNQLTQLHCCKRKNNPYGPENPQSTYAWETQNNCG